jgi:ComF family protein
MPNAIYTIYNAANTVLHEWMNMLFPTQCMHCHTALHRHEHMLCLACQASLPIGPKYIPHNSMEQLLMGRVKCQSAAALLHFYKQNTTQSLLHGLKYKGQIHIADYLATLLAPLIHSMPIPLHNCILIPVPLAAKKFAKRGFNQSQLITDALANILQVPTSNTFLQRIKNTETQTSKSRTERIQNVHDAFEVKQGFKLQGKHIILLDDVCTTGATIEACGLAINAIPDTQLSIISVAIALQ